MKVTRSLVETETETSEIDVLILSNKKFICPVTVQVNTLYLTNFPSSVYVLIDLRIRVLAFHP